MSQEQMITEKSGAERRRERRFEVQIEGQLGVDGEVYPVKIADLSGSGALLTMRRPPPQNEICDLWIPGFDFLEVKIAFSGTDICGVMFTEPAKYRDRLLKWLLEDIGVGPES